MTDLIEQLQVKHKGQKKEIGSLCGLLRKSAKGTNKGMSTPTAPTKNTQMATSPAESQAATPIEKRKMQDTAPKDWNLVSGRKAKRTNQSKGEVTTQTLETAGNMGTVPDVTLISEGIAPLIVTTSTYPLIWEAAQQPGYTVLRPKSGNWQNWTQRSYPRR